MRRPRGAANAPWWPATVGTGKPASRSSGARRRPPECVGRGKPPGAEDDRDARRDPARPGEDLARGALGERERVLVRHARRLPNRPAAPERERWSSRQQRSEEGRATLVAARSDPDRVPDGLGLDEAEEPRGARVARPVVVVGHAARHALDVGRPRGLGGAARARSARPRGRARRRRGARRAPGTSSSAGPVSRFTTPPGTSDVASTSVRVTAGIGRRSSATTTTVLATAMRRRDHRHEPEQRRVVRRDDADDAGRLGHREVEVGTGDGVGRPGDLGDLVGPSRVPDPPVDGRVHLAARGARRRALGVAHRRDELVAAVLQQLGDAVEDLAAVVGRGRRPPRSAARAAATRVADVLARRPRRVREEPAVGTTRRRRSVRTPIAGRRRR